MMALSATSAMWLLIAALPISLFVAWNDMRSMKIPNVAVMALVISFAVLGLLAFPFYTVLVAMGAFGRRTFDRLLTQCSTRSRRRGRKIRSRSRAICHGR